MKIEFIASFAVITPDPDKSRTLYLDALALPLNAEEGDDYLHSEEIGGSRHFGVWPLSQAAQACFGKPEWPSERPTPQASVEFEVEDADAVQTAAEELRAKGYELLHDAAVVTDPQDGREVNDAVGAVPLVANYPREQQSYGRSAIRSTSPTLSRCGAATRRYGGDDPNAGPGAQQPPIAIGCDMGDGASGGGWIVSGAGIGSLTSFSYDLHPDVLYGPYFGDRALPCSARPSLWSRGGRGPGAPVRGLRPGVAGLQPPLRHGRRAGASVQGPRAGQHQLPGLRRQSGIRAHMRKRANRRARRVRLPLLPARRDRPARRRVVGGRPSGRALAIQVRPENSECRARP